MTLMSDRQPDLFGSPALAPPSVSDDYVVLIRKRMNETVAMMTAAQAMPWPDRIAIVHVENGFRADLEVLPQAEADAIWAVFDREMDRLFALAHAAEDAAEAAAAQALAAPAG